MNRVERYVLVVTAQPDCRKGARHVIRKPRVFFAGGTYHVYCRAARGERPFADDDVAASFLDTIEAVKDEHNLTILAWCLMPNYYHLVLRSGGLPLWRSMRLIKGRFAKSFNRRQRVFGPMWQGRYKSRLIDDTTYHMQAIAYVHLNPVASGMVKDPGVYRWSGHRQILGRVRRGLLDVNEALLVFGSTRSEALRTYRGVLGRGREEGWMKEWPGRLPWWQRAIEKGEELRADPKKPRLDRQGMVQRPEPPKVDAVDVLRTVAKTLEVSAESLGGANRAFELQRARELVMLVGVEQCGMKVKDLALVIGRGRDAGSADRLYTQAEVVILAGNRIQNADKQRNVMIRLICVVKRTPAFVRLLAITIIFSCWCVQTSTASIDGTNSKVHNGGENSKKPSHIAIIDSPTAGRTLTNVCQGCSSDVVVKGTAGDKSLQRWSLDFGQGEDPTTWTVIAKGMSPVINGTLGRWATAALTNGIYTLRLQVWNKKGHAVKTARVLEIANFTLSQDVLQMNGSKDEKITYTSTVPFPLTVSIVIKNQHGQVVRSLIKEKRNKGNYSDSWDGKKDDGFLAPDGPYFVVATANDDERSMVCDQSTQYLRNYFDSKDPLKIEPFDPFNNKPMTVTYNSVVPGLITISGMTKNMISNECDQPVEKALCIVNRQYEESGQHTFVWAGVDASGVYRADLYSSLSITMLRDRFAKNAVILYGTKPRVRNVRIDPPMMTPSLAEASVNFDLETFENCQADVTVTFLNQASKSILRTISLAAQKSGHISTVWDGRSDGGILVAPGFYTITVAVKDTLGNQVQGQTLATVHR